MTNLGEGFNRLSDVFSQGDIHSAIKTAMASKFPPIMQIDETKPWFAQIRTKFDRLVTSEPGFLRRLIASSLFMTKVLADHLRASTGREPSQDDYIIFHGSNEDARKIVYEQVRVQRRTCDRCIC